MRNEYEIVRNEGRKEERRTSLYLLIFFPSPRTSLREEGERKEKRREE